jgi:hypothetical protein
MRKILLALWIASSLGFASVTWADVKPANPFGATGDAGAAITKDVVEDLNSVSTVYAAKAKNGATVRSIYNLSARGNYTVLFFTPKPK